jgi:hypothetical protein
MRQVSNYKKEDSLVTGLFRVLVVTPWAFHYQSNTANWTQEIAKSGFVLFFPRYNVPVDDATGQSQPFLSGRKNVPLFLCDVRRTVERVNFKGFIGRNVFPVFEFHGMILGFGRIFVAVRKPTETAINNRNFGRSPPLIYPDDLYSGLPGASGFSTLGFFYKNPWPLRIDNRLSLQFCRVSGSANGGTLLFYSEQGEKGGDGSAQPDDNDPIVWPERRPPWRWPVVRLVTGTFCLFAVAWTIVRFGYRRIRLGICGCWLFAVGWLLLLTPSGWNWF